jgi:hypothetical protein
VPLVRLTVVGNEIEAAVLCGMLRTHGFECDYRQTDLAAGISRGAITPAGPTEVLVEAKQLQAARELLLDT